MTPSQYIDALQAQYKTGRATEHSHRPALQRLLEALLPALTITNEPQRIRCGAPDFIIQRGEIPVGYLEAKDIPVSLDDKANKEQFDRYRASLQNLCITNYLEFRFYENGAFLTSVAIGTLTPTGVVPQPEAFQRFEHLILDFAARVTQTLTTAKTLAEAMATKARLLATTLESALKPDVEADAQNALTDQYRAFRDVLIHDITPRAFADLYAQTVAYGMFAARLHDDELHTFSRQEAAERIPHSNPFLRRLFQHIAGYDLDTRIRWIVDALADVFRAADVAAIMRDMGRGARKEDPVIHFYETFLAAYDPALRKARGVWYTPEPVVRFIVRAVDDILVRDFGLKDGLADIAKTKIKVKLADKATADRRSVLKEKEVEVEVPRVQILDPATGTGTFIAEVIRRIHTRFAGMQGMWSSYVEKDLLPRLHGFELLMASYAMAHLKLDLLLTETGYKTKPDAEAQRFRVYLTNSLEEHHPDTGGLFASFLSAEANEANRVKRDAPVMAVIGNPPYAVSSSNKSEWIESLMADYKKDLKEQNVQPLSDDYIKFIRFAQYFIERNGEGVLAFITNNSFIDGVIHRQMRKSILDAFDDVYIINLHGNTKKKEVTLDGARDENVFDIMQSVSINLFIKKPTKRTVGHPTVRYFGLRGPREEKYEFLNSHNLEDINWIEVVPSTPKFKFTPSDAETERVYHIGFEITELFKQSSSGIETRKDFLVTSIDNEALQHVIEDFRHLSVQELERKYHLDDKSRDWKIQWAKDDVTANRPKILGYHTRPFDYRYIIYTGRSKGIVGYPMFKNFQHLLPKGNFGLIAKRGRLIGSNNVFAHVFVTNSLTDKNFLADLSYVFPLYLYPEASLYSTARIPNLKEEIVQKIADGLGWKFQTEPEAGSVSYALGIRDRAGFFSPIDLLDYIYAVLHHPGYREKYKEFLKIDFPRVPYPTDAAHFRALAALGAELRAWHLLEHPDVDKGEVTYPVDGDNVVDKPGFEPWVYEEAVPDENGEMHYPDYLGTVRINATQYFDRVPTRAWEFYIGGYQPAQKWLKDRRGRALTFDDIRHYRRIIAALTATDDVMKNLAALDL